MHESDNFLIMFISLNSSLKAKYKFRFLKRLGSYVFEEDDRSISESFLWRYIMTILHYQESNNASSC